MNPLNIITSGAFAAALERLAPLYCERFSERISLHFGSSLGAAHDSIPTRLAQGQVFDAFILARKGLDDLAVEGHLAKGQGWDLVESNIGVAVRVEDDVPDILTLASFKETLLSSRRIALAASASGIYLKNEVFPMLGISEQMRQSAFTVLSERVGHVVARKEADIGFQQASEIIPIKSVKLAGFLPKEIRKPFYFSAAIGCKCTKIKRTLMFLAYLASNECASTIIATGLRPLMPCIEPHL
jgi:molybdate transport system substrate-binding protein